MGRKNKGKRLIRFRQWTRKNYSVLVSLGKVIRIGVLCASYSLANKMPVIHAQNDTVPISLNTYELDEIEVIGRRSQLASSEVTRVISVIQRDEIEQSGAGTIGDILEFISNADIRQRGVAGIQADISLRGSSFDHIMVLINGVPLGDPQTGHFNLDIPIEPQTIERVEILEGSAARTLGPGAFSGAINFVTRMPEKEFVFSQTFGEHQLLQSHFHTGFKTGLVNSFISAGSSGSAGYIENTDFSMYNVYMRSTVQKEYSRIDFQGGYQYKEFGAAGFYSPRFPDQYEETGTRFASISASSGNQLRIHSRIYWRRKKDHFLLIRNNPVFYENYHLTDVYGSQFNLSYHKKIVTATIGLDQRSENILSNNIGFLMPEKREVKGSDSGYYTKQYQRTNFASFFEVIIKTNRLNLAGGAMLNWNTGFDKAPFLFPGLDIGYKLARKMVLFASVNRSLHLPTFTDLFYTDPVNQGNLDLNPNRMSSLEGGLSFTNSAFQSRIAGFYNFGKEIVDWVWNYSGNRFSPVNLKSYKVTGFSASLSVNFSEYAITDRLLKTLSVNYIWLNTSKSVSDSVSKYYNLRHKISVSLTQNPIKNLSLYWSMSYQDRFGEAIQYLSSESKYSFKPYKPYWLLNGTVKWNINILQIFAEVSNILNTRFFDAGSVEQPRRWLRVGLTVKFQ